MKSTSSSSRTSSSCRPTPNSGSACSASVTFGVYGLMNHRTGPMKGPLSQQAQANFEKGFWTVAKANSKLAEAKPRHLGDGGFREPSPGQQIVRLAGGAVPSQHSGVCQPEVRRWLDAGPAVCGSPRLFLKMVRRAGQTRPVCGGRLAELSGRQRRPRCSTSATSPRTSCSAKRPTCISTWSMPTSPKRLCSRRAAARRAA